MPSQIEGMIQNMIQAGIPHAQMMQFLQQSLHQAAGASPSPAINHNNAGGAQSTAAQQAAAAVVAAHQAAQAAAHQQHFQPPSAAVHPQHQSAASSVAQNTGAASGVGPTGGAGAGVGQQQHAASNGGTGAALGPAGVAASLQHLASLQQQQQLLAAHHQHQHPHNPAVVASVHQAHAAAGQPTSAALQASSLMQMAAAHPHHQPAAGLAAMQQQLQQTAAAGATHPMAAAFAQAQLAAAAAQQQQHAVANTGAVAGAGLSTGLSGVAAANLQQQHVQQLASSVAQNAAAAQQTAPPLAIPSLAWPIFQPIVNIPYFDMTTYQKVNLDVQPSAMANGMDLPLNDINTLRFFFNFGVQHARAILLRQHINSQAANQQQQQQQQHQQHQLALLQQQNQLAGNAAANNGTQQGSQELNSANEQLQIQQKLLVHQSLLNQMPMGSMPPNENCAQFNSGGTPTIGGTAFRPGGGGIMQIGQGGQFSGGGSVGQMMENSGGEKQTQQILLMNNGQTIGIGGAPTTVMNQQQQQMATMIGGPGGLNALGQSPLMGMGGEEGGNGEMTKGGNCGGMGKGQGNNNSNVGNKKSVNTIGQQLQERAQNDAAAVAAAAAAIEKSTGNSMSNAAGSGAAQLLQGGMAGLAGLQNPLQMNQLAAMMANQQGAGQQAKIGNLNSGEVNDLGTGGASAVAQQLRMAQSNNPQQAQLAAMQQLLIQQQQQQLAAALAQQQQQNEQDQQQNQQQTGNELGRTQLISNNTSSVGGTPTNSTPSTQIPNNQSGQFGINSGGGSANGTPQSTGGGGGNNGGRGSVNGQQMANSVSPKNGAVVPTDPAPRKPPSAQIVANPLNAELNDLKQRGLNALRSPEAMNEGLQKRIVEMANTLNTVSMGTVAVGGGGNGGPGGNGSSGIVSLGGGPGGCAGAQLPPAILLQQQQQIYQQQQQLLQQHLLQQQLLQTQSAPPQQPPQSQQLSMAAQLSAALANNFVTPNGAQPQRQTNFPQNVHAENDSAPALLSATEMHYTETFKNNQHQDGMKRKQMRPTDLAGMAPELEIGAGLSQRRKSGVYMLNNMNAKEERKTPMTSGGGGTGAAPSQSGNAANTAPSTAVSTSAMMNFMNNMLTTAKSHLQGQGLGLYYDQNGNPIDYSSRPIDPIFRKAREDLNHSPGATANGGTLVQGASAGTTSASMQPSMAQIPAETQTTSAVGGDLGFLSRTCLIGISDGRRGSVGNAQQLTAQQPVPLNALYSGNLTPQQLQQHYLQLQQQQQQLQQLQQIQQLQQQIHQQQNEQFQQQGAVESAENGKKRALDGAIEEGAPSAKSSRVDSDIEIVQETYKTPRAESSSHQNQMDQVATPQNQPPSSSDGHPPEQNIPPFTAPEELNNATVIDSGTIGGEENQQQGMEREEEDEERAAGGNEGNGIEQQEREEEDGGSPASGKQLRIAEEEEEDGP